MNVPYWIAHRYFFSRKKRSFISMLSILSMLGVGVGTMALVVVLSVFNGMEELNRAIFKTFEADITISPKQGKRFTVSADLLTRIRQTPGVGLVTSVIEDNALARYADAQTVVKLKGVEDNYLQRRQLDTAVVEGRLQLRETNANFAIVAEGVRNELSIRREDVLTPLELWYPQRGATLTVLSDDAFNQQALNVAGVFFIEQRYDDYVIAPIGVVQALVDYEPGELTNIEIQLASNAGLASVKKALQPVVGENLQIRDRDDLNTDLYRAIRIEKLFVALTLSFIILVASMNIFFSLSMLVIEKKEDIRILNAMGATPGLIRRIFLTEGTIIALIGALVGLALGVGLCWLQEEYGFVRMGTVSSIIDAYPVRVEIEDLILTGTVVTLITLLTSWFPAQRAARSMA
ncbi:FtsX-like permease family protein [Nibrella viscosa]|uniref:FtsX-like permease family protein n=1 Tax=Nibrella viscosa TaxID=1084524 RepID=A0ABP8KDR2_9BACT